MVVGGGAEEIRLGKIKIIASLMVLFSVPVFLRASFR